MAAKDKVDLQIRGMPVSLQRRIREKAASKAGTAAIRAIRDAIDRA